MPKRKNSSPVKLNHFMSSLEFSVKGINSASSKRVSFNIPSAYEGSENVDNSIKFKSKKLHKVIPENCVILGDISFIIFDSDNIFLDWNNVDLNILLNEAEEYLEVKLKISQSVVKNISAILELSVPNELLLKSISDLMQHQYIWVVKKEKVQKDTLKICIVTTYEKTPIFKSTNILKLFFGLDVPVYNQEISKSQKTCFEEFFKEIQNYQKLNLVLSDKNVQHEKLLPELRPYQAKAVQWMLNRENNILEPQNIDWFPSVVITLKSKCNKNIFYNKYSGLLSLDISSFPKLPKGGILADEMGLGKTVAVISLILNHIRNIEEEEDNNDFLLSSATNHINNIVFKSSTEFNCDDLEISTKNKEDHLDSHEKLIHNKISKGPALKRALSEWYESKLAEYSTTQNKIKKVNNNGLKCLCGNTSFTKKKDCVQCPGCSRFQHMECVAYKENFQYFCPPCWKKQKLVKSKGTLIVTPTSIYHQWFEEIKKHVSPDGFPNGVLMYKGLRDGFIQPSVLSEYDVVITTYFILRSEINHAVEDNSQRKLRNEERFLKTCSPLTCIQWWRLCLDEAQMVENDYSQMNKMVNLISSVNRWSVTGTPIQKSLDDLYYLLEWLGFQPFNLRSYWNDLLHLPYINGNKLPMCSVLSKVLWRNTKVDVAGELLIPEQTVKYHFLKFTAIEQNFYMREHAVSLSDFSERLRKLRLDEKQTIDSLDKITLTRLLAPLLNLRQACSHPLAVKGRKISSKTGSVTLTELLLYLFNKTKVECEEAMRLHIAALNGLAGLSCIKKNWSEAVNYYRQVLLYAEEYKEKIHIDSLQRIHTLTNLAEILHLHPRSRHPTLRDDSLKTDAQELENKYMQKTAEDLASNESQLNELSSKVSELHKKFETGPQVWWHHLVSLLVLDNTIDELLEKISSELSTNEVDKKKNVEVFLSKISSVKGIEIMLRNWLSSVEENRNKALHQLEVLRKSSLEDLLYNAVDCHLRTLAVETKKKKCLLCNCENVLLDYECALFDVSRKVLKERYQKVLDGAQTKGSWRAKNAEKCLRVLLSVGKSKNITEPWCLKDGRTYIQMLEAMKKEFKQLREVWRSIHQKVLAFDEISMCKLRLRLRLPGEPIPPKMTRLSLSEQNKAEAIYIINHHEVGPQKLKLSGELDVSKSEFKKKYGTLLYLKNLGQKENPKPEPCPVCKTVLENEWCVLQCGHSYCIDCIRIMLTRSPKPSLNCPVCRETTKSCDLGFIDLSGKQEDSDINVVGDHSTKVESIVRSLLELKKKDPKVKVLIFSTWEVVLKILEVALTQNGVSFRRMPGSQYQLHLQQFLDPSLNVTALLLPISWGSKGLNLIEASHVFLIEPIMNPAEELQAIGRVHRIGQTKETVVHRFLICGTIEEKIHTSVSEAKEKWGQKKVTLEDLKNLFDIKNEIVTSTGREK